MKQLKATMIEIQLVIAVGTGMTALYKAGLIDWPWLAIWIGTIMLDLTGFIRRTK